MQLHDPVLLSMSVCHGSANLENNIFAFLSSEYIMQEDSTSNVLYFSEIKCLYELKLFHLLGSTGLAG